MANKDLKQAAELFQKSTKSLMETLNGMTENVVKETTKNLDLENAKKFSNFVNSGGLDDLIEKAVNKAKSQAK